MFETYVIIACLVTWFLLSLWGLTNVRANWHVRSLRPVDAKITNIWTRSERRDSSAGLKIDHSYHHYFSYKLILNKTAYRGSSEQGFIGLLSTINRSEQKISDNVTVYYNPANPTNNLYSRSPLYAGIFLILLGGLFLYMTVDLYISWKMG